MSTHQIHYGKKFYQDKKTGYWISTTSPRIRAHVWVWKQCHTSIPKGWHVHHRDENKSNNEISNLTIMSVSAHAKHHTHNEPGRLERMQKLAESNRVLTKEWHASKEGREWHKAHGLMTWVKRKTIIITCKSCGKEAETKTYHQEFCSNKCKSKCRRKSGVDNEKRTCLNCVCDFLCNKYAKTKYCSRKCAGSGN